MFGYGSIMFYSKKFRWGNYSFLERH